MKNKLVTLFIVFSFIGGVILLSRDFRVTQIPNGSVNTCQNCHMSPFGGDARNDFGQLVEARFLSSLSASGNVEWGPLLASLDADNDGVTNGQELQDPYGIWTSGSDDPGNSALVTLPGSAESNPLTTLTINFSEMNPHVDQTLYLRVIDKQNGKEIGRTSTTITENFAVELDVILTGGSYYIDFFADFNQNGTYDAPPEDHAWRLELDDAQGNDQLEFVHNTEFTDIQWEYLLTINFTGMTPHVGQLLELRVVDNQSSEEIGRTRLESISSADFEINIPGLELNNEYTVEFYADFNQNGTYDEPPTDHAWAIDVESTEGDVSTTFSHNTDFTTIEWKYLYTLNLLSMNPHLGQMLELRVYEEGSSDEVGRIKLDEILIPNFSVSIPQIEMNTDYVVDFYADFNQNGQYDAPPEDHTWRLTFNSSTGNHVQNFTHNTEFTDIEWPGTTDREDENIPVDFVLAQNYPNPFNPTTSIEYQVPSRENVVLKVYDLLGEEITTLVNEQKSPGNYEVQFDGSRLASGVYLYRLQAGEYSFTKKMILMK